MKKTFVAAVLSLCVPLCQCAATTDPVVLHPTDDCYVTAALTDMSGGLDNYLWTMFCDQSLAPHPTTHPPIQIGQVP
jgi:hypothetical protein